VSPHLSVLKVPLNKKKLLKFLFSDINNNENIRTFNNSGYLHSLWIGVKRNPSSAISCSIKRRQPYYYLLFIYLIIYLFIITNK